MKYTPYKKSPSIFSFSRELEEINGVTVIFLEVFVETRPGCIPNYEKDAISAIYYTVHSELA